MVSLDLLPRYCLLDSLFVNTETTKVDYVLYQTSVLLKDAVIREWPLLEKSDVHALKTYLLHYILENTR